MTNNRFIVDTNIIVSSLLFSSSPPRLAFNKAYVASSKVTILELEEVLNRKKFDKYISKEKRIQFIAKFFDDVELIEIVEIVSELFNFRTNQHPKNKRRHLFFWFTKLTLLYNKL